MGRGAGPEAGCVAVACEGAVPQARPREPAFRMSRESPLGGDGDALGLGGGTHRRASLLQGWVHRTVVAMHVNVSTATPGQLGDGCPGHLPQDRREPPLPSGQRGGDRGRGAAAKDSRAGIGVRRGPGRGPAPFLRPRRAHEGGSYLRALTVCPDTRTMRQLNKIWMLLNLT